MEIKCSVLDPPSIRGSGEIRATKAAVSAGAHGKQSFSGGCLMGRFRLLAVHSDICLDDRTFLIFCLVGFCCCLGCFFFTVSIQRHWSRLYKEATDSPLLQVSEAQ